MATFLNGAGEAMVGECSSHKIRYVQQSLGEKLTTIDLDIEPRDWDVTDADARGAAAREQLGDDHDWYCEQRRVQWWIDPTRNAAGLAVYQRRENN